MSSFAETGPREPVTEGIRVDKVQPRARLGKKIRAIIVVIVAIILLVPVAVMAITAFKSRADVVSVPPKLFFEPTLEGFVFLLTERSQLSGDALVEAKANADNLGIFERVALDNGQRINGPSDFIRRLTNSIIIAFGATIASVTLGLFAAYAFSRFDIPGANDLLFFILSGRMLPAVVVAIPIFLMYRQLGLYDTHLGMILIYTVFNLSLTVWLLKGFIDEIPREYEEAAVIDGTSHLGAFVRITLPLSTPALVITALFSFMAGWSEFIVARVIIADQDLYTLPLGLESLQSTFQTEWANYAAGSLLVCIPVVALFLLLSRFLISGLTLGGVKG